MAERIGVVFAKLPDYDYECLFVNDGSTDRTHAELESFGRAIPKCTLSILSRIEGNRRRW